MEFWEFGLIFIVIIIGGLIKYTFSKADKDKISYLQGENDRLRDNNNEVYDSSGRRLN